MSGQIILYGPDNQPIKLLGEPQTAAYRPQTDLQQIASFGARRNPILTLLKMEEMLLDPAIKLGLSFLKAPIRKATLIIKSKNPALREWLATNIRRFWRLPLRRVMRGFEYGFSGCEVMYEMAEDAAGDKKIFIKGLKDFAPRDTRPLTYRGQIAGIRVKCPVNISAASVGGNVDLIGPKALWYAHDMRAGNWFGRSVLMGTQGTYEERNGKDGALDSRFHWYYRHAFRGPSVRYPTQNFVKPGADGELMYLSGRDIAAEIATLGKNGQATIMPSMKDKNGNEMFTVEWPQQSTSSGMDIRDYVKDLRAETWNGLEIPDEIIAAEGTGALAGRRIPERAFYSSREDELNEIIDFLDPQVLKPVAMMNYGRDAQYELLIGEIAPTEQDDGQDGGDGGGNGQKPGGGNPFGNWLMPQQNGGDDEGGGDENDKPTKFSLPLMRDRVDRWQRHMADDEKALVLGTELVDPMRPAQVAVGVRLSVPSDGFGVPIAGQTMVDPIAKLAAERGMSLSNELRSKLVRLVARNTTMNPTEFLRSAARMIAQYQPRLAALVKDTIIAAWIIGAKRGALHLPEDVREDVQNQTSVENAFKHGLARHDMLPPVPPSVTTAFYQPGERPSVVFPAIEEAFADLQARHILDAADFYKLGDQARAASFTVSYVNGTDTLETIRDKLADAVSTGGTLADFKTGIGEAMDASPLGVSHIETVFRNNIQSATSAGQERVINDPLVIDAFPYAIYEGLADTRQRETHNEMMHQGIPINGRGSNVYRSDDPIWDIWTPPNGHRCRCGKTFITLRQAARLGIQEAKDWLATGTPPANPWHSPTTLQPDPGFASRPAIGGGTAVGLSRPSVRYDLTAHRSMVLDGRAYQTGDAVPLFALDIDAATCANYFAPVRLSTMHAPTGGITINGKEYEGGQFIPGEQQGAAKSEAAKTIQHVRDTHDGYSFKTTSRDEQLATMKRLGYGKEEAAALVSSIGKADRDDAAKMYEDAVHGAPIHKIADAELTETDDSLSADQLSAWYGHDQDHFHDQLTERLKAAGLSSSKAARVAVTAADHVENGAADKAAAFIADSLPKTEAAPVESGPAMLTRKAWHDQEKVKEGYDVSKSNREYWSMIGDAVKEGKPVNADAAEQYHKMFGEPSSEESTSTPPVEPVRERETFATDLAKEKRREKLQEVLAAGRVEPSSPLLDEFADESWVKDVRIEPPKTVAPEITVPTETPAAPFKPVPVPGEQMGLFNTDPGGQKKLFDIEKTKHAAKTPEAARSLLEKIGDELDQRQAEIAPLPDQSDLFDSPRAAAEYQRAVDDDYVFARKSSVRNAGEDLKGSARHKRNEWRGLEDAEKNGTAAEFVTRDNLLKAEPHNLMSHSDKHPLTALAMHHALKALPPKPGNGKSATAEKDRRDYVEAYQRLKTNAEELAASEPDAIKAIDAMRGHVRSMLEELRKRKIPTGYGDNQMTDSYNATANALTHTYKALKQSAYGTPGAHSVAGKLASFTDAFANKYHSETEGLHPAVESARRGAFAKSLVSAGHDNLADHVKDIIEGRSLPESFDVKSSGTGNRGFNSADKYVKYATRKGGRDVSEVTGDANKAAKHLLNSYGARGVQFGNSVTDEERKHHAAKLVESLADLADVTGLKPEDLGLGGKLGWAIGARGTGMAAAHYEPGTQVINLTRKNGVGALAHEWGHAFDHSIHGFQLTSDGERHGGDYASDRISSDRFVKNPDGTWKMDGKKVATESSKDDPIWKAFDGVRKAFKDSGFQNRSAAQVSAMKLTGELTAQKAKYWNSTIERFARAFEMHAQHALREQDRDNTYLTGLADHGAESLWPTREESKAMAPAFDALFAAYRKQKYGDDKPVKLSHVAFIASLRKLGDDTP